MTSLDTILVIDNDLSVGKLITNILVKEGKRVLLASNAKEGMEHLKKERVDILFSDVRLPDEDGISFIRKSLQVHPRIAAVVLTTAETLETAIEALRVGACDYIIKPFNQQQIATTLQRAINWARHTQSTEKPKAILPSKMKLPQVTFLATSPSMQEVVGLAKKLSNIEFPVLIQGEIGVGKQLLARLIHNRSCYANGPFSHVSCSVIPDIPKLFQSFIHQLFRVLNELPKDDSSQLPSMGTIYFEDIDQLPIWAQHQLLDMLEDGCIRASCSSSMAARMIASTTTNLKTAVSA
ncbi:MAG: response regulator, partial [Planctomycetota bacterium]